MDILTVILIAAIIVAAITNAAKFAFNKSQLRHKLLTAIQPRSQDQYEIWRKAKGSGSTKLSWEDWAKKYNADHNKDQIALAQSLADEARREGDVTARVSSYLPRIRLSLDPSQQEFSGVKKEILITYEEKKGRVGKFKLAPHDPFGEPCEACKASSDGKLCKACKTRSEAEVCKAHSEIVDIFFGSSQQAYLLELVTALKINPDFYWVRLDVLESNEYPEFGLNPIQISDSRTNRPVAVFCPSTAKCWIIEKAKPSRFASGDEYVARSAFAHELRELIFG